MKKLHYLLSGISLLSLCALLSGCGATASAVITDYDREADFSDYNTYFWTDEFQMRYNGAQDVDPLFYNTLVKKRLKQAIQKEMEGRGYVLSSEDPDILVSAQVIVQEDNRGQRYAPHPYYGFYSFGPPYYAGDTGTEREGNVVIELIDPNEHQLVWQGYARGVLDEGTEDKREELRKAVSLVFGEFPYRAGQGR